MKTWTMKELAGYILKLCSECSGEQFANEKHVRALVAYKTLQFFCRKGFKPDPMMPRTIQTLASDMYAALENMGYLVHSRTFVSDKNIIQFTNSKNVDAGHLSECYRQIKTKGEKDDD